jgi:thiol-disulfide isomerase/thioredoxin
MRARGRSGRATSSIPAAQSAVVRSLALALATAVVLTGCSEGGNTVAAQAQGQGDRGYISADGTVESIAVADRQTSIRVQGTTLEGKPLDTSSERGKVVVLNTWGSWCPPCNAEAADLQKVWQEQRSNGVQFVGIALREEPATGIAFQRRFGITYPSVRWDGGKVLLQLKGKATAPPTTLVLDKQGRLAARVSGKVDAGTLSGLVDDVRNESS